MIKNQNTSLIILGIIVVLLTAGVIRPLFLSIKQNSKDLVIQKGSLINFEKKNDNLKKFQLTYDIYQTNFKRLDQLFINKETPVDFIEFLEKEAGRFKLTIDLTPINLKVKKDDFWPSTVFQADVTGSFQNFLKFLEKIESSPYLIVLSDFNLNKPVKAIKDDIVVVFQMKIYTK